MRIFLRRAQKNAAIGIPILKYLVLFPNRSLCVPVRESVAPEHRLLRDRSKASRIEYDIRGAPSSFRSIHDLCSQVVAYFYGERFDHGFQKFYFKSPLQCQLVIFPKRCSGFNRQLCFFYFLRSAKSSICYYSLWWDGSFITTWRQSLFGLTNG